MSVLVLHTFGILEHPADHPASQAFQQAIPDVIASLSDTPGLLKSSVNFFWPDGTSGNETTEFGSPVTPRFFDLSEGRFALTTLSAWTEVEAAAGFSFQRTHGKAMENRTEWFRQEHFWPSSVLWWTDDMEAVTWEEGNMKLAYLHENGPSHAAFAFKSLYSSTGESVRMDAQRVKKLGTGNHEPADKP